MSMDPIYLLIGTGVRFRTFMYVNAHYVYVGEIVYRD
jgi:hypothetical protein